MQSLELINQHPELIELSGQTARLERITFYQNRGCRKGDAVIAAHAEALGIKTKSPIPSTMSEMSTELITASEANARLASS